MRSKAYGRTASTTPRTARSGRGSRLGALRTKVTRSSPGVTKMVSPLSSTPAPPAPSAQCTTALPGKWPPHWTRVTPPSTSRVPDQASGGLGHQHLGVEGPAPFRHRPVEVGVAGGDGPQPTGRPDRRHGRLVQVAGQVPEEVPGV